MNSMPNVSFDKRNLRKDEEILFTFKPDKKSYMRRNFFFGGGIPFPVVLIWTVIDFGLLIGVPLGTGDYWLWAILIPFMAVHGAPIWIYLYGVIGGAKDYYACGHMITTERIITRKSRKQPFTEFEIADTSSLTILSTKKRASSLHISGIKELTLYSLHRADIEKAINVFYDLKEREKHKTLNEKYRITCTQCGGRTNNGYCMYCGSKAELKNEVVNIEKYAKKKK